MTLTDWLVLWGQASILMGASWIACRVLKSNPRAVVLISRASLVLLLGLLALPAIRQDLRPIAPAVTVDLPQMLYATPDTKLVQAGETPTQIKTVENGGFPGEAYMATEMVIACSWALGSFIVLSWLLCGMARISLLRWQSVRVARSLANIPIRESARVELPFVVGAFRPTIYVPQGWIATTDDACQQSILRHEECHVLSGDLRWQLFYRMLTVIFWPVPGVWMMRKPMHLASEQVCDDAVLQSGCSPASYAKCLLDLHQSRAIPMLAIGAADRRSSFGIRIRTILAGQPIRRLTGMTKLSMLAIVLAVGAAAFLAIGAKRQPGYVAQAQQEPRPEIVKVKVLDQSGAPLKSGTGHVLIVGGREMASFQVSIKDGVATVRFGNRHELQSRFPQIGPYADYLGARFWIYEPGSAVAFKSIWPSAKAELTIQLQAGTILESSIEAPAGKPQAGVGVHPSIISVGSAENHEFLHLKPGEGPSAVTDAQGNFKLVDMPKGAQVQIDIDSANIARFGFEHAQKLSDQSVTKVPPYVGTSSATFIGKVLVSGRGVAGIKVGAQGMDKYGWGDSITDANGRFSIQRLPADRYIVALNLPQDYDWTAVAHESVDIFAGTTKSLDFKLEYGSIISGVVTGPDGRPLPGAMVGCYGPAHPKTGAWVQGVVADGSGRYKLRVPPGKQYVYLMDEKNTNVSEHVETRAGEAVTIDLQAKE